MVLTFVKLPFIFKPFVLPIFEWPFKTGFTVMMGQGRSAVLIVEVEVRVSFAGRRYNLTFLKNFLWEVIWHGLNIFDFLVKPY